MAIVADKSGNYPDGVPPFDSTLATSGGAVSVADGADVAQGAVADAAYTTGNGTVISLLKGLFAKFAVGAGTAATATRVTFASDAPTLAVTGPSRNEYEFVAASQTTQVLGAGLGAIGDYCEHLLVIPLTTSPGNVQLKDGAGTAMTVFAGGASSVTSLVPFNIYVGAASVAGAWQVTTGANVQVIAAGNYT